MENFVKHNDAVVAVGNFDGVHIGHQKVIQTARKFAEEKSAKTVALTFSPHPRRFFGDVSPFLITDDEMKQKLLLSYGADEVVFRKFDSAFAEKCPNDFVDYLKNDLHCICVVCGENFRFGKKAKFGISDLAFAAQAVGIKIIAVKLENSSSTLIRDALFNGDIAEASRMLGREFSLSGNVIHGNHIGTDIGFPTANLELSEQAYLLKHGVYVVKVNVDGKFYDGITNVGFRPTINGNSQLSVETHIPKLNSDLYGKEIIIGFRSFIRPERRFDNIEQLKKMIAEDCKVAFEYVTANAAE